jgi:hypothetical protein
MRAQQYRSLNGRYFPVCGRRAEESHENPEAKWLVCGFIFEPAPPTVRNWVQTTQEQYLVSHFKIFTHRLSSTSGRFQR